MIELIIYTLIGLFFSIIIGVFIIFIIKEDDFLEELIVFSIIYLAYNCAFIIFKFIVLFYL